MSRYRMGGHPAATAETLRQASVVLGWDGEILPGLSIAGTRVSAVVALDHQAHQRRVAASDGPCLDPDTLTMWEWPEGRDIYPPSPLSVVGVLAHEGRTVKALLTAARKWRGISASAVLLPPGQSMGERLLLECSYAGIAVLEQGSTGVEVVQPGSPDRLPPARRTIYDRWTEEHLYGHLLRQNGHGVLL